MTPAEFAAWLGDRKREGPRPVEEESFCGWMRLDLTPAELDGAGLPKGAEVFTRNIDEYSLSEMCVWTLEGRGVVRTFDEMQVVFPWG